MRKLKPETLLTERHSTVLLCHRDSLIIEDAVACKYFNVIVAFLKTFLWSLCRLIPDFHKHFMSCVGDCWRLLWDCWRRLLASTWDKMTKCDEGRCDTRWSSVFWNIQTVTSLPITDCLHRQEQQLILEILALACKAGESCFIWFCSGFKNTWHVCVSNNKLMPHDEPCIVSHYSLSYS